MYGLSLVTKGFLTKKDTFIPTPISTGGGAVYLKEKEFIQPKIEIDKVELIAENGDSQEIIFEIDSVKLL